MAGTAEKRRPRARPTPPPGAAPLGHNGAVAEFLIITGMSGAGRSQAGATLEDLGWFVIDNMPTALITKVAELVGAPGSTTDRVALVVGRDAEQLEELEAGRAPAARRAGPGPQSCSSRRPTRCWCAASRAPAGATRSARRGVTEAIALERELLEPIRALADVVVDTTDLNVNQLRDRLIELFTSDRAEPHADLGHVVRVQARGAARRRHRVRLPVPAQPALGRRAAAADRARRRRCGDYVLGQPDAAEFLAASTTCSASCCRPTSRRASRT